PTWTRTELFFEMRLPEGTSIGVTDATAKKAEQMLAGDKAIVSYTSYVGAGAPRFCLGLNPVLPNPNFAQIVIVTKDLKVRERVSRRAPAGHAPGARPGGPSPASPASCRARRSAIRSSSASSGPTP